MARKGNVLLTGNDLWQRHVRLYYEIFLVALERLSMEAMLKKTEPEISEQLFLVLQEVCMEEIKKNRDMRDPDWEKPIPPEEQTGRPNSAKKPDFTCTLFNPDFSKSEDYRKDLHIECKRLNDDTKAGSLPDHYVTEGIQRFDAQTHRYGRGVDTGFMIGYIVSGDPAEILKSVNKYINIRMASVPLQSENTYNGVMIHKQIMSRKSVRPEEFSLFHFWKNLKAG